MDSNRAICWAPLWSDRHAGVGLEHLVLREGAADSVLLAFDERGRPFRLGYRLAWDKGWRLREAELSAMTEDAERSLVLRTDGAGSWRDGTGRALPAVDGCLDIDIWPTPFTNTFPLRRAPMSVGERREFRMAWVAAPELVVTPQPQRYTRRAERLYRFESLDGSGFCADLAVDGDAIVLDYPGLFRRVA